MDNDSQQIQIDWDLLSYVISSSLRFRVLITLNKRVFTPKQLSEELDVQMSRISTVLKELVEKDLVTCLTPQQRKGKLYAITERGRKLLKEIHSKTKIK